MTDVDVEGEVDAGWKSYFDPEQHGNTVDVVDSEGNGSVSNSEIPDHIDPDELTDKQLAIIKAAARFPDYGTSKLSTICSTSDSYIYRVLSTHWPSRLREKFSRISESDCNEIRQSLLDGQQYSDINYKHTAIARHSKGRCNHNPKAPPITYDRSKREYRTKSSDTSTSQEGNGQNDSSVKCQYCGAEYPTERARNGHYASCEEYIKSRDDADEQPGELEEESTQADSKGHTEETEKTEIDEPPTSEDRASDLQYQETSTVVEVGITAALLFTVVLAIYTAWRMVKYAFRLVKR